MSSAVSELRRTPLCDTHCQLKAKLIEFGGWYMPVQYSGILQEHTAVRTAVGLFDVSHMGEIEVRGPDAEKLVNYVSTNNAAKLKVGQAQYSGLLYEHGGFVDDILVHKVSDYAFLHLRERFEPVERPRAHRAGEAQRQFPGGSGVRKRTLRAIGDSGPSSFGDSCKS